MNEIPLSLRTAVDAWSDAGNPDQRPFVWRPESWTRRFDRANATPVPGVDLVASVKTIQEHSAERLGGDVHRIDRTVVKHLHTTEVLRSGTDGYDRQAVVTAFIAAMIWGYGVTGYGPYRTERVLTATPDAVDALVHVAEVAQGSPDGGEKAFAEIADAKRTNRHYLKYLGPAFGTKLLSFLTLGAEPKVEVVPVMDAVVRRWFRTETSIRLDTWKWDPKSYRGYIEALDTWRQELTDVAGSLSRDQLEMVLFTVARGDAVEWSSAAQIRVAEELGVDALLELLRPDISALADESGSPRGIELLEDLARWVDQVSASQN